MLESGRFSEDREGEPSLTPTVRKASKEDEDEVVVPSLSSAELPVLLPH